MYKIDVTALIALHQAAIWQSLERVLGDTPCDVATLEREANERENRREAIRCLLNRR